MTNLFIIKRITGIPLGEFATFAFADVRVGHIRDFSGKWSDKAGKS